MVGVSATQWHEGVHTQQCAEPTLTIAGLHVSLQVSPEGAQGLR